MLVIAAFAGSGWVLHAASATDRQDTAALVAHVADRVAAYYQRAQKLICIERSTMIPITPDWQVAGFARTVESEMRVELDAVDGDRVPDAQVTRHIQRVNGREPKARDFSDRSGCTDPTPISPEPLAFVLPGHREDFTFTNVRETRERNRGALVIDFASVQRTSRPELIEDEFGHDDCFDWKGTLAVAGRLWVDASTYDVLRLDRHVAGPTDVRVPQRLQTKYHFAQFLTLERDDSSLRYKGVDFHDPDETVLLPESIESTTVFRGGLQSMRRTEVFSNYQRFLTGIGSIRIK